MEYKSRVQPLGSIHRNLLIYFPESSLSLALHCRFYSAGGPDVKLIRATDSVALNYSSNTRCDRDPSMNMSTIINFKCDPKQTNKISYVRTGAPCTHQFEWFTPQGCDHRVTTPCQAYSATDDFHYDFRSLRNQSFEVSRNGTKYLFGVCTAPPAGACSEGIGACNSQGYILGSVNDKLLVNETGYPYLVYDKGPNCTNGQPFFTKIEFTCAKSDAEDMKPFLVEDTNCRLIIQFATRLACPKKILCKDGDYDLTPLMNSESNYEAEVADAVLKGPTGEEHKGAKVSGGRKPNPIQVSLN